MKVKTIIAALSVLAALVSCSKDSLDSYAGSYIYKISGSVKVTDLPDHSDTLTFQLNTESGRMEVLKDGTGLVLTFNDIFGEASVLNAEVEDDAIFVSGGNKFVKAGSTLHSCSGTVRVTGVGRKLSDTIVLTLDYNGELNGTINDYKIVESDIKCVAKAN